MELSSKISGEQTKTETKVESVQKLAEALESPEANFLFLVGYLYGHGVKKGDIVVVTRFSSEPPVEALGRQV